MTADQTPIVPPALASPLLGPPAPPPSEIAVVRLTATPSRRGRGPHTQTLTGGAWWSYDPSPDDVRLGDLRALSHINRFGGHTLVPYSDAEHMVRVARRVRALGGSLIVTRAALGHDAHESYPPADQLGPFLRAWSSEEACAILGMTPAAFDGIAAVVRLAKTAVRERLGILDVFEVPEMARLIRHADVELLATERRDLMAPSDVEWGPLPDPLPERIVPWSPTHAWAEWLNMLEETGGWP